MRGKITNIGWDFTEGLPNENTPSPQNTMLTKFVI